MEPIPIGRTRWKRSPERADADTGLEIQMLRDGLYHRHRDLPPLDTAEYAIWVEWLACCELAAEVEPRWQRVLERRVAVTEGRQPAGTPPPAAPGARPRRQLQAA